MVFGQTLSSSLHRYGEQSRYNMFHHEKKTSKATVSYEFFFECLPASMCVHVIVYARVYEKKTPLSCS